MKRIILWVILCCLVSVTSVAATKTFEVSDSCEICAYEQRQDTLFIRVNGYPRLIMCKLKTFKPVHLRLEWSRFDFGIVLLVLYDDERIHHRTPIGIFTYSLVEDGIVFWPNI